jgi:putative transposase
VRALVEPEHKTLSVRRQCELLGLGRSSYYYEPVPESAANLALMRQIDRQYLATPFYGSRRMTVWLQEQGQDVNRKRVQRLMRLMGLEALYARPRTTIRGVGHKVYPYLLRGLKVTRPNQVWATDITYVGLRHGFLYLTAILDWHSRYVLAWRLSNSLDGKGRALDNVFTERLWRTVKYEEIYLKDYADGADCHSAIERYFPFYNEERFHQALDYQTPAAVYLGKATRKVEPIVCGVRK